MDTARVIGFVLWAVLLVGGYSLWWYFDAKNKRLKAELKKKESQDGEAEEEENKDHPAEP